MQRVTEASGTAHKVLDGKVRPDSFSARDFFFFFLCVYREIYAHSRLQREIASAGTGKAVREVGTARLCVVRLLLTRDSSDALSGGAGTGNFTVANEEEVASTISTLRRDDGGKTWLLLSYQARPRVLIFFFFLK
jgi:hypothetical protein